MFTCSSKADMKVCAAMEHASCQPDWPKMVRAFQFTDHGTPSFPGMTNHVTVHTWNHVRRAERYIKDNGVAIQKESLI